MDCEHFELYASAYIDNALSEKEKLEFENHTDECDYCNIKLQNLKIVVESINNIEEIELPRNFSNELKSKLEKESEIEKPNNIKNIISNYKKMLGVIAGIFIIITSITLINNFSIYINRNNLHSGVDKLGKGKEEITFDIASEESMEAVDELENNDINQPRIMAIDNNIEAKQEMANEESIESTNNEENNNIMPGENNEDSLEYKNAENKPIEKNRNRVMNISVSALIVGATSIFIYKKFKK